MLPELVTPVPGPHSRELAQKLRAHESRNVTYVSPRFPVFWQRTQGANVWDVDGNRFLDLTSGFGVASLGFNPPTIMSAARGQLDRLYHAMGDVHPAQEKVDLCAKLSALTFEAWGLGAGKTILANSGSEAVEAALKTAWLATRKPGVLAFTGGYHGLGYGALTVTGRELFRAPFEPQLADFATFLPFPDSLRETDRDGFLRAAEQAFAQREIGAILVEPVQGRGGEVVPPAWLLPDLRALADRFGAALIFDEIYTGFHRTGRRFACEHTDARPDLICLGKALTGGFPLAACVGRGELMDEAWPESTGEALHTSTFLGNPLGCRMALESLALFQAEPWDDRVQSLGAHLAEGLSRLHHGNPARFGAPHGRGLMQGLDVIDRDARPDPARAGVLVEEMLARGFILLSGGTAQNVLSFTPPFVITPPEIDFALAQLAEAAG
jgi:4-aminobutyrate aminotransferase-like enzyme